MKAKSRIVQRVGLFCLASAVAAGLFWRTALVIGNLRSSNGFSGLIDNLRIYSRALTTTEVQTDMNTSIP